MAITSPSRHMPRSTPDPAPCHRNDPPAKRTRWMPVLRMSVAAGMAAAIPHTSIQLLFADGARMLHMATGPIFVVGTVDSLFLFVMHHKP